MQVGLYATSDFISTWLIEHWAKQQSRDQKVASSSPVAAAMQLYTKIAVPTCSTGKLAQFC